MLLMSFLFHFSFHFLFISGASSVLASECNIAYNDLDLIFSVDLTSQKQYEQVDDVTFTVDRTFDRSMWPLQLTLQQVDQCDLYSWPYIL